VRIATWNVNGLRARLDFVLLWLKDRQPDIVGLQELKLTDDQFPHEAIRNAGYHAVTHGQKAWNGVAIISREPVTVTQLGLPGQEELGARLLSADAGGLSFTTVYCPNGKDVGHADFPRKLAWFDALATHWKTRFSADTPAILCGDFNVCPEAIDSWSEETLRGQILHTEQERARFQSLLDLGLVDAYRALSPDGLAYSWWDYRGGSFPRNQGLRIDFLLATPGVMARVRTVEIDREYRKKKAGLTASDHTPVYADLN
jgi:exodeoxyribonuclease-3